jgi:Bax protein
MKLRQRNRLFQVIVVTGVVILVALLTRTPEFKTKNLQLLQKDITSVDSIIPPGDSTVIPVSYQGVPDFTDLDPQIRKEKFIQFMLPAVMIVRHQLMEDLRHVEFIESRMVKTEPIAPADTIFLNQMFLKYHTDSIDVLKRRIYPHPVSLVIAQAALESGWGTSRFFREGNNIFGVWSFDDDDSRIASKYKRNGRTIYLKSYSSYIQSISNYYLTIARVPYYKRFRLQRWKGASSIELLPYLSRYSEKSQYAQLAGSIIRENGIQKYDDYSLREYEHKSGIMLLIQDKLKFW